MRLGRLLAILLLIMVMADAALFSLAPPAFLAPAPPEAYLGRTDAAAVLFHDFANRYHGIDAETQRRINHAIVLYRQVTAVLSPGFAPIPFSEET